MRLEPGLISLTVRADGSAPVALAQVQVDDAWRAFTITPDAPIGRLGTAQIDMPYPWVEGETHHLKLLTATGVAFDHTIEVAQSTPALTPQTLTMLTLVGLLLGLAPVAIGLLAYPAIRQAGPSALRFLLALTVGLLVFLMVDTLSEGLELAPKPSAACAARRWSGSPRSSPPPCCSASAVGAARRREAWRSPVFIALGIGLHNLGEGLVVGTALATGAAALASFLVVGFVIHNVTEGFGIAAPLPKTRPPLAVFVGLAALAGLPAVIGVWAAKPSRSAPTGRALFRHRCRRDTPGRHRALGLACARERRAPHHASDRFGFRPGPRHHVRHGPLCMRRDDRASSSSRVPFPVPRATSTTRRFGRSPP